MAARSWGDWIRTLWRERLQAPMIVAVAAGLLLSFIGPFGTGDARPLVRVLYWVGVMSLGTVVGVSMRPLLEKVGWFAGNIWLEAAANTVLITAVGSVLIWLATDLVYGLSFSSNQLSFFLAPVAVLTTAMTALNYALNRQPPATHAAPESAPPPRFIDRLPANLQSAALQAVEAEDHYLRVHTDRGDTLILLRLADAISELEGIEGAQTHRSWWVARSAVQTARRGDGRAALTLVSGVTVPVSRTYARSLRDAGWF